MESEINNIVTKKKSDPDRNAIFGHGFADVIDQYDWDETLRLVTEALGGSAKWDGYLDGAAVTSAESSYDAVDLYWLSHVIYAESGAESMEGQIAVGNVVLNRVASSEFRFPGGL